MSKIIQHLFGLQVLNNFSDFDWLKTERGGKQEIDIWVPSVKLAIEYDGRQHFEPVCFGGVSLEQAKENFIRTQELDLIKSKKIKQHADDIKHFVRFNYEEDIDADYVRIKLENAGVCIVKRHEPLFCDLLSDILSPNLNLYSKSGLADMLE